MSDTQVLSRRSILSLIAGSASAGVLAGCQRARPLTAADNAVSDYPTVRGLNYFGELLEARTDGRLRMDIYPGGQLGEERDTLEITIMGGLDINRVNIAPLNSIAKATIVPTLPFMFRSIDHMRRSMDGRAGDEILKSLAPHGLIGLCFYDNGARNLYTTSRLIRSPEDLNGLKIRVQNSDIFVALINALGGDATPMAYGEVYQALMQRVVDGAENNLPSYQSSRHFEAAKYYTETQHVMAPEVVVMSEKSWRKLTPADRDLVRECARESVPFMRTLWDARVERAREEVMAAGVQTVAVEVDAFRQRVEPIWERYLGDESLRGLASLIQRVDSA